ncbi:MAG: NUDIX domain-containing protein [Bacteroidia bacterium]|nr:NUDIX domain-containing protein [Bacteroidia bacterium]
MQEALQKSAKFKLWKRHLEENGLDIHGIEEVYSRIWRGDEVLFSLVMLDASAPEGKKIPPICFLKGEVSCVMVVLIDEDSGARYNLLVKQRRICHGGFVYEQVAGLVDEGETPHEVAVREVEEETGIKVSPEQVIQLNEEPYYPSTGTSDEAMYYFYCELTMSKEQILSFAGNETGVASEHEQIFTHVATLPEAFDLIKNPNGVLNMVLYQKAKGEYSI